MADKPKSLSDFAAKSFGVKKKPLRYAELRKKKA